MLTKKYLNELTYEVLGSAIEVHKTLGCGLLESVYHECFKEELLYRGIDYQSEVKVPIFYRSKILDVNLRCDLIVQNCLVVELKSVQEMPNIFDAQLLTYMKLLKFPKGVLINLIALIFSKKEKEL